MGDIFLYTGLILLTFCILLELHLCVVNRKKSKTMQEMRKVLEHTITSIIEETKEAHLIAKSCLNLTHNRIEFYEQKQEIGIFREPQDTYTDLLEKVAATAVLPENRRN